jgi:hypothetical protein
VSQLPFVLVVKLFPILADPASAVLIFKVVLNSGEAFAPAFGLSLLCALSPIVILVSDDDGQFDGEHGSIPRVCLVPLAFWQKDAGRLGCPALMLGLAILNKAWPAIFLPIVFFRLQLELVKE